ncbi:MAG TPA: hypothetical protein VKP14_02390 [Gaiellaceae bacterium]|nr:hypothetical protein [Gaiellaceae bacterium]
MSAVVRSAAGHSRRSLGRLLAITWLVAVVNVSIAANARPGWVSALAASPDRVREGKLWFLVSSAVLVDRPVALSLLSFTALAVSALILCGTRTFWWSAFLGQVLATMLVYAFIGVARWFVVGAFDSSVASPDYGVSTVCAAWLGSIAALMWRRRGRSALGKLSIASSCVAVGLFAYSVRPDVSVLSSEHLVAFALGVGAAIPGLMRRLFDLMLRGPIEMVRALTLSTVSGRPKPARAVLPVVLPLVIAIALAPSGLAALHHQIATHLEPTVSRCARDWNELNAVSRPPVGAYSSSLVSLAVTHNTLAGEGNGKSHRAFRTDYCRFTFIEGARALVVLGWWHRGRVDRWNISFASRTTSALTNNATLERDGRLRLRNRRDHLSLAS